MQDFDFIDIDLDDEKISLDDLLFLEAERTLSRIECEKILNNELLNSEIEKEDKEDKAKTL